ncbi:hypothetical protein LCGC14_2431490 [marine sediment metagenome]|uniref:Uncharacterized protein n=1 Tax=marine sediment metagenome TaxID=412755 RepID=A0A0F9BLY6_9ZZZZ
MSSPVELAHFGIDIPGHLYAQPITEIGEEMRQGRCKPCAMAFRWPIHGVHRPLQLSEAHCPHCGRPLTQTTHLLRAANWMNILEPLTDGGARKHFPRRATS